MEALHRPHEGKVRELEKKRAREAINTISIKLPK